LEQLLLVQCLFSLLLLCTAAAPTDSRSLFVTDADMGIHTYNSLVEVSNHPVNVRLHLRFICNQDTGSTAGSSGNPSSIDSSRTDSSSIRVEGFVSTYVITTKPPAWAPGAPHYVPWHIQRHLNISISSKWVPEKFLGT
jgi:hypothetical protein